MNARGTVLAVTAAVCVIASDGHAEQRGIAAVYSYKGGRTASGELSRPAEMTAAHRTLPFGTKVKVTNQRNGRTVIVRINDRGPFTPGRVIDLTPAAANQLGFSGLAHVRLDVVGR
jgi:rare lipoprotein A